MENATLKYTCYKCKYIWTDYLEDIYGECEGECPECTSRHNTPEAIKVYPYLCYLD